MYAITQSQIDQIKQDNIKTQKFIDDEQKRVVKDSINNPKSLDFSPKNKKAKTRTSKNCIKIENVKVIGVKLLDYDYIKKLENRYSNRCLKVNDIELILTELTNKYINNGYIASRVYLPQQKIPKVLQIMVMEGQIEDIKVDSNSSLFLGNITPNMKGNPVQINDLEQAIAQLNRLSSNNATFELQPGSKDGDSIILLKNQMSKRYSLSSSYDNQGSKSTGERSASFTFGLDNPFGLNDNLNYTYKLSYPNIKDEKEMIMKSISYSVPYGYYNFSFSNSDTLSKSMYLAGVDKVYSTNKSKSKSLTIDYLAYKKKMESFKVSLNITQSDTKAILNILGAMIESGSHSVVSNLSVSYAIPLWDAMLTIDGALKKGKLKDMDDSGDTNSKFQLYTYGINLVLPFKVLDESFMFNSSLSGQYAKQILPSSQTFSIGGLYSVRGFNNNSLSGDNGFYIRNELSYTSGVLKFYVGYDYGYIEDEGGLTGAVVGTTLSYSLMNLDLFYTIPLHRGALSDEVFYPNQDEEKTYFRMNLNY
jgi:hemolysin activation/secretion protein